jgi:hypothetical protein
LASRDTTPLQAARQVNAIVSAGDRMHLDADELYSEPKEDDYPFIVGFQDDTADWCLIFTRFSDLTPDRGTINVMVRDQTHTETANLRLVLYRSQCHVRLDQETASKLLGIDEYVVDFVADAETYRLLVQRQRAIFEGLAGLTIGDEPDKS